MTLLICALLAPCKHFWLPQVSIECWMIRNTIIEVGYHLIDLLLHHPPSRRNSKEKEFKLGLWEGWFRCMTKFTRLLAAEDKMWSCLLYENIICVYCSKRMYLLAFGKIELKFTSPTHPLPLHFKMLKVRWKPIFSSNECWLWGTEGVCSKQASKAPLT